MTCKDAYKIGFDLYSKVSFISHVICHWFEQCCKFLFYLIRRVSKRLECSNIFWMTTWSRHLQAKQLLGYRWHQKHNIETTKNKRNENEGNLFYLMLWLVLNHQEIFFSSIRAIYTFMRFGKKSFYCLYELKKELRNKCLTTNFNALYI